jgi:hypothetical protein
MDLQDYFLPHNFDFSTRVTLSFGDTWFETLILS